jgi:outer membrane protein TolC
MSRVPASLAALLLSVSLLAPVHAEPPPRPTIREVLRMALRAARTLGPERTRELCRRARLAGLVPTLKLSAQRGLQQDLSSSQGLETDRTNSSQGDDLSLEASLSFELSRLVFASEEVRVLSVERWLVADRRRLIEEVTRLYFQRQRLLRERAAAAAPDAELDAAIAEAEALLDAFTDGGFSAPTRPAEPRR